MGSHGSGSCLPAHALPLHPGCPNWAVRNPLWFRAASGRLLRGLGRRGGTPCQLQGHHQITLRLPLRRSGLDRNQLRFPQARLGGVVSPPAALAPSPLYNSGCHVLRGIEVTGLRMETTGERRQQREERSRLGRGAKAAGVSHGTASLSPPTAKLDAAAARQHGPLARSPRCSGTRAAGEAMLWGWLSS